MTYPPITPRRVDPLALDRDGGQAGMLTPASRIWSPGTVTLTADRAYANLFVPSRDIRVNALRVLLQTAAGSDDALELALYEVANSTTAHKIATTGSQTGKLTGSAGARGVALSAQKLVKARTPYYAVLAAQVQTTGAVLSAANFGTGINAAAFGTNAGVADDFFVNSSRPLPDDLSVAGGQITATPLILLMEAT